MGDTKIPWATKTWNPVTGCTKVSPGCANCYIERTPPFRKERRRFEDGAIPVQLHPGRLNQPLHWRKPQRVFVASMGDLFHEDVPDGFIAWVWLTMAKTYHTFLVLTKRPGRMQEFVARWADLTGETSDFQGVRGPDETRAAHPSGRGQLFAAYLHELGRPLGGEPPPGAAWPTFDWMEGPRWWPTLPLPNVWLGVTAENQAMADERIPWLLETPAAKRFVSVEPMLGAVDLNKYLSTLRRYCPVHDYGEPGYPPSECSECEHGPALDWVIVGGESGPHHRPLDLDWVSAVRGLCDAAGVAYFGKQNAGDKAGAPLPGELSDRAFPEEADP